MSAREAYVKKLQAQLDVWGSEIDVLRAKAGKAEADVQVKLHNKIEELQGRQSELNTKIAEIRSASEESWEDLKDGAERAWRDLGDAVKSAASRFG